MYENWKLLQFFFVFQLNRNKQRPLLKFRGIHPQKRLFAFWPNGIETLAVRIKCSYFQMPIKRRRKTKFSKHG